ncbi:MAG: sortase [Roseiflexaceae bacterium]|nr:sortase [Roseiflexaceae bacterium]
MTRFSRVTFASRGQGRRTQSSVLTARARMLWTIGNLCMLGGAIVLLYVGGVYATDEYGRYAARGDSDVPAPAAVDESAASEPAPFIAPPPVVAPTPPVAAAARLPVVAGHPLPTATPAPIWHTAVTRLVIPSIKLDAKVVEVGWDLVGDDGQQNPVWQVAKYAVGHHRDSGNPGEGNNIVLAGHVGGYGQVFRDLFYVHPGEEVILYADGQQLRYTITERLVLDEEGAPPEQRAANAELIAPTDSEVLTMVTCWPGTGPAKFTQRVVVRAVPAADTSAG